MTNIIIIYEYGHYRNYVTWLNKQNVCKAVNFNNSVQVLLRRRYMQYVYNTLSGGFVYFDTGQFLYSMTVEAIKPIIPFCAGDSLVAHRNPGKGSHDTALVKSVAVSTN